MNSLGAIYGECERHVNHNKPSHVSILVTRSWTISAINENIIVYMNLRFLKCSAGYFEIYMSIRSNNIYQSANILDENIDIFTASAISKSTGKDTKHRTE